MLSGMRLVCAVKHQSQVFVLLIRIESLNSREHRALEQFRTNNENSLVDKTVDYLRIGNNLNRRTVDNNLVVFLANTLHQFFKAAVEEQFSWVGRNYTHRDNVKIRILNTAQNDFIV